MAEETKEEEGYQYLCHIQSTSRMIYLLLTLGEADTYYNSTVLKRTKYTKNHEVKQISFNHIINIAMFENPTLHYKHGYSR